MSVGLAGKGWISGPRPYAIANEGGWWRVYGRSLASHSRCWVKLPFRFTSREQAVAFTKRARRNQRALLG